MRKIISFLTLCLILNLGNAQLVSVFHEVFYTDDGTVAAYPEEFTTYRVYASMTDPTDFLSSVYAATNDILTIGSSTNTIWNSSFGAATGDALNSAFFGFVPQLEYDSFVTIGRANNEDPGASVNIVESLPGTALMNGFDATGDDEFDTNVTLIDGAWFALNGDVNGLGTGVDNRVLIAQITTDGTLEYNLNVQIFPLGNGVNAMLYVGDCNTVDSSDFDGHCLGLHYPEDGLCSCLPIEGGCTNSNAINYDSLATSDDGSCIVPDCGAGSPLNVEYCYVNGSIQSFTYTSTSPGVNNVMIYFREGTIEDDWDTINIYDGVDNSSPLLFSGSGNMTGNWFESTGDNITIEIVADGGVSCESGSEIILDYDIYCGEELLFACIDPSACNYDSTATEDDGSCIYPQANDNCYGAMDITGNINGENIYCNNDGCTTESGMTHSCSGFGENYDLFYSFLYEGGEITFETIDIGDLDDTRMSIWDACNGTEIACDDDGGPMFFSKITVGCPDLTIGNTYIIQVDGYNGQQGAFELQMSNNLIIACYNYDEMVCIYYSDCGPLDNSTCDWSGCNDPTACNFQSGVAWDDGSCCYDNCGCTDETAVNYNPNSDCHDCSCIYYGCTDPDACNYDLFVNTDDGSCEYESCAGCMDIFSCNYNPSVTIDNGSCDYSCIGCTQINACNYDSTATEDNGSCDYSCYGCLDSSACNYDSTATEDDGSCIYAQANDNCYGAMDITGNINGENIYCNNNGCTTESGMPHSCSGFGENYDLFYSFLYEGGEITFETIDIGDLDDTRMSIWDACNGTEIACDDDGGPMFFSKITVGCPDLTIGNTYIIQVDGYNGQQGAFELQITHEPIFGCYSYNPYTCTFYIDECLDGIDPNCDLWVSGCLNIEACNYNPAATIDNGNCCYDNCGCTDENASNYDAAAECQDCSCEYEGCTDSTACNFVSEAPIDDGSCEYESCVGCMDIFSCNYNPNVTIDNGSCDYSCIGCTQINACNYDSTATEDNGSCDYSCYGCLDSSACNYDSTATISDSQTCEYESCAGCMDSLACNYDSTAFLENNSCDYSCYGCIDSIACNFNSNSTIDDDSCEYVSCAGCTNSIACNFDSLATIDDGNCTYTGDVNVSQDIEICLGDSTTIIASGGVQYFWDGEELGDSLSVWPFETTVYSVLIIEDNSCETYFSVTVSVNPLPEAGFIQDGNILTASAAESYQWYLNGNAIDGANNQNYTITEDGNYSVEVGNEYDCTSISDQVYIVYIGVKEFDASSFSVYPNPTSSSATLNFKDNNSSYDVQIISSSGQLIRSYENVSEDKLILERRDIATGNYIIRVIDRQTKRSSEMKIVFE